MTTDRNEALEPESGRMREMGLAALDVVTEYLASLPGRPIMPEVTSDSIRRSLDQELPVEGKSFESLVRSVRDSIFAASRHNGHPRFFGYVASPGTAATALADLLASALNSNVTSWRSAPAGTGTESWPQPWMRRSRCVLSPAMTLSSWERSWKAEKTHSSR